MKTPARLDREALKALPLPPVADGSKDEHGAILVIAGSRDVPGAALLAAHGAMRAGAGKLQIACPDEIAVPLGIAMPEAMVVGHKTSRDGGFARSAIARLAELGSRADAIVAGPGLGRIITRGFDNRRTYEVLAGALLVAVGALILEGLAVLVERLADPMRAAKRQGT